MRSGWPLVFVGALVTIAGLVEPPAPYDNGPYSARWVYVNNPDRTCRLMLGEISPSRRFLGCYVRMTNEIYISRDCDPTRGPIGSTCTALRRHEEGHARGGVHDEEGRWK